MREIIFRWNDQIPVQFMRIEPLGKLYAYSEHNDDEMVFQVVPNGGYRGSSKMLKAFRMKHAPKRAKQVKRKRTQVKREKSKGTQAKAGELLGVSQSAIAKYETGENVMLLRVALEIQRLNTGKSYDNSWQEIHKREKIFKLNSGTHIALMRIDALGKRFAYAYHKDDMMVFKVVPKVVNQGSGKLLKAFRVEHHWTQAQAGQGG